MYIKRNTMWGLHEIGIQSYSGLHYSDIESNSTSIQSSPQNYVCSLIFHATDGSYKKWVAEPLEIFGLSVLPAKKTEVSSEDYYERYSIDIYFNNDNKKDAIKVIDFAVACIAADNNGNKNNDVLTYIARVVKAIGMLDDLSNATKAVLVSNPASLKVIGLKQVQTFHNDGILSAQQIQQLPIELKEHLTLKYDHSHTPTLIDAMNLAVNQMGSRFFADNYAGKKQDLIKRIPLASIIEEMFLDKAIEFVYEASKPRGGYLNYYKAAFGQTKSAQTFYNFLEQKGLHELAQSIRENVEARNAMQETGMTCLTPNLT